LIGDFLCLTIETVSRTLTKLKMVGLIESPPSNHVYISPRISVRVIGSSKRAGSCPLRSLPLGEGRSP
jgi:regulatory Crp family protein